MAGALAQNANCLLTSHVPAGISDKRPRKRSTAVSYTAAGGKVLRLLRRDVEMCNRRLARQHNVKPHGRFGCVCFHMQDAPLS